MEAVIFIGVPGAGKSSFFKERFFHTHVRISLDLLKTRHRERRLIEACLATDQRFVIDKTNPTKKDRAGYIQAAKAKSYRLIGYAQRSDGERVPAVAILAAAKRLEPPSWDDGFDQLFYVRIGDKGFVVEEWRDDL